MKEGWEYIPFENGLEPVCKTAKISNSDYLNSGKYPIVSQEDSYISGYWNDDDDVLHLIHPVVVFGDHTRVLKYIDFDFVIGADGVKVLSPISDIEPKFFYYYLRWCNIPSLGYSRHYKLLKELNIPVPPIDQQHRIVSELDLLSSIIEKQKNQLKELDTLAQSIFYDMFGDPVTNEKGWSVKRLEEICEITSSKRIFAEEYIESGIPFYRSKEVIEKSQNLPISVELYISTEKYNQIKEKFGVPQVGDILITAVGTIGKIWSVDTEEPFYFKDGNLVWLRQIKHQAVGTVFFRESLSKLIEQYKKANANGAAYDALTIMNLKKMQCVLPPLPLQQQFAEKIQSIESQKATISKSIAESQKLFDYTMDKYFG